MDKHRVMNFVTSLGYWSKIEIEENHDIVTYLNAYNEDGDRVDLMVSDENGEYLVYQSYNSEGWVLVDMP